MGRNVHFLAHGPLKPCRDYSAVPRGGDAAEIFYFGACRLTSRALCGAVEVWVRRGL
jgi:hypothetical protein